MGSHAVVGLFSRKDVAMGSTKKILATLPAAFLAASVAYTGSATAADLLVDPPVYEAPEIVTKSSGFLWGGSGKFECSNRNASETDDTASLAWTGEGARALPPDTIRLLDSPLQGFRKAS